MHTCICTGVHTFAAIEEEESYTHLSKGFEPVFQEINSIIANGSITADGHTYPLQMYLGGDYKVIINIYHHSPLLVAIVNSVSSDIDGIEYGKFNIRLPLLSCPK